MNLIQKINGGTKDEDNEIRVVVLHASLKKDINSSNTYHLTKIVEQHLNENGVRLVHYFNLADMTIGVGITEYVDTPDDEMHLIYDAIRKANIVIVATPIWWGYPSSLAQKVIERMDEFDEIFLKQGTNQIYNKVFGVVVTGAEDGAMNCIARLNMWASFLGFTIPPENSCYWVGEVGIGDGDVEKYKENEVTMSMAKTMAHRLVHFTELLTKDPIKS